MYTYYIIRYFIYVNGYIGECILLLLVLLLMYCYWYYCYYYYFITHEYMKQKPKTRNAKKGITFVITTSKKVQYFSPTVSWHSFGGFSRPASHTHT